MEQGSPKAILTVEEVAELLRISRTHAYSLVHQSGFPTMWLGRAIRIPRAALERWIEKQQSKGNGDDDRHVG